MWVQWTDWRIVDNLCFPTYVINANIRENQGVLFFWQEREREYIKDTHETVKGLSTSWREHLCLTCANTHIQTAAQSSYSTNTQTKRAYTHLHQLSTHPATHSTFVVKKLRTSSPPKPRRRRRRGTTFGYTRHAEIYRSSQPIHS